MSQKISNLATKALPEKSQKILVYLPALNEEETIENVLKSIPETLNTFGKLDFLVVDDGSTDKTAFIAKRTGANVISHSQNMGVGAAFHSAVEFALVNDFDILVSIDADGQFDSNQIENLLLPILCNKADFSTGIRFSKSKPNNMPWIKYWGNMQVNRLISIFTKEKIEDASCGFRAYSRDCLMALNLIGSFTYTHESILELVYKDFRLAQIPVTVEYFPDRVSRVANSIKRYALQSLRIILKSFRDYRPFVFFSSIGLIFLSLSFILALFPAINWLNTGYITPFKSLGVISLSFFLLSFCFVITGVITDMFSRVRVTQERQLYMLKKLYYENKPSK